MQLASLIRRFLPLAGFGAVYLVVGLGLRLVLWWKFGRAADVSSLALTWIVPAGVVADAVQLVYLLVPVLLLLWLVPARGVRSRLVPWLLLTAAGLFFTWMLFLGVVEYFFFEEFDARFNLVSFDYLLYPTEVVGDIWAEYPVVLALIAAAMGGIVLVVCMRKPLTRGAYAAADLRARSILVAVWMLLLLGGATGFRTDALAFSTNRVANELAVNGVSSFFRAARTSEIDYPAYYRTADRRSNFVRVRKALDRGDGTFTRLAEGRLDRAFPARADGLGRLNVVVVACESFGAEFSRLYGSERDWTPNFDRYAQEGLWFAHTYASGTRTVRGLEAIAASFPPIPSVSILRRPRNEDVAGWGKVMRELGYTTDFLYGGYGYFDNMNAFFASNGYAVVDRNDIPQPVRFENIWGVADEDLYDAALARFDQRAATGQPFFAIVMNTSNHKPYTFREGLEAYGIQATGGRRQSGVRYADYALGYLLAAAQAHAWFDDTVFVVLADHGARVYGSQEIPLKSYEIPFMIYAPKHIPPGRVDSLVTQVDVAPTVLGLLGLPYEAPFFGQDALHTPDAGRVAYLNHNYDVGILRDDRLAVLGLHDTLRDYRVNRTADTYEAVPGDPDLDALTVAVYQTATEMFHERRYR
ncbi:MAG: LTA synthase family protein [Pseudomonadales bacterium]